MGMGRAAGSAMQNQMGGMGGKGGQQPQGGFRGKGGAQQPQGGFGGKGAGQYQPQQQPQGGFSGKGGQQQQNPYAQQYYQPQFQPEYFNNPYAQGGFGQQPQMGGFGGKGGQMGGMSDLQRLAPNMQGDGTSYQDYVNRPTQEMKMSEAQFNAQRGGMGGKGGQMPQYNPTANPIDGPQSRPPQQGGMRGKGGSQSNLPAYAQPYFARMLRGEAMRQPSGLAALQQPTATTQAASPAPEQPYMGNYMS